MCDLKLFINNPTSVDIRTHSKFMLFMASEQQRNMILPDIISRWMIKHDCAKKFVLR